jgi:outer membrane protein TolC
LRRALLALAIVQPTLALAQPAMPTVTLPQALAWAREHQPQIRAALAQAAARRAEVGVPRGQWLPQLGATVQLLGGTTNNSSAQYLTTPETDLPRIGGTRGNTTGWAPQPSTLVAISVDQEVYDFGRITAEIATADAVAAEARATAEAARLDVQLAVEEAYASVLAARHVLAATDQALARAVTHRDYAQAGVRAGLQPPVNLTHSQADVAQLEARRVQAAGGLDVARAALAAAMAADELEVDAVEPAPDESPAPALAAVLREAAARNPAVVAAQARRRAATAEATASTAALLPNLFASAGVSGRAGGAPVSQGTTATGGGWLPAIPNWHVGLILQWALFDATVLARRDAARARAEAARFELEAARVVVGLAAARVWLDLDTAQKVLPGLQASVAAAQANLSQMVARFRSGLGNIVELADAETLLTNAQLQLAVGQFNVARARAQLGRVVAGALHPRAR